MATHACWKIRGEQIAAAAIPLRGLSASELTRQRPEQALKVIQDMKQRSVTLAAFLLFVVLTVSACSAAGSGQDGYAQQRHQTLQQLGKVIALNNQAIEFANSLPQFQQVSAADMAHLQSLWRATLVQAKKVNIAILNKEEPGFGNDFRDKFIRGLELCTGENAKQDLVKGQILLATFGREFSAVRAKHTGGGR